MAAALQALGDGAAVTTVLFFDMDGTLVQAQANHVHREAFSVALKEVFGIECKITDVDHSGRTDTWIIKALLAKYGVTDEAAIAAGMQRVYDLMCGEVRERRRELQESLRVLPGVPALLRAVSGRPDVAVGLVTGNLMRIAMTKLVSTGLDPFFTCGGFGEDSAVRSELVSSGLARARAKLPGLRADNELKVFIIGDTPHDLHAATGAQAAIHGGAAAGATASAGEHGSSAAAASAPAGPAAAEAMDGSSLPPGVYGVGVATGPYSQDQLRAVPGAHAAILPSLEDTAAVLRVFGIPPTA